MQCWQRVAPGTAGLPQPVHWASWDGPSQVGFPHPRMLGSSTRRQPLHLPEQPPVTSRYSSDSGGGVFSDWDCSARFGSDPADPGDCSAPLGSSLAPGQARPGIEGGVGACRSALLGMTSPLGGWMRPRDLSSLNIHIPVGALPLFPRIYPHVSPHGPFGAVGRHSGSP